MHHVSLSEKHRPSACPAPITPNYARDGPEPGRGNLWLNLYLLPERRDVAKRRRRQEGQGVVYETELAHKISKRRREQDREDCQRY